MFGGILHAVAPFASCVSSARICAKNSIGITCLLGWPYESLLLSRARSTHSIRLLGVCPHLASRAFLLRLKLFNSLDHFPYNSPVKTGAKRLLNKSIDAAVAAIEIYNKPHFKYREENFSILMLNAWELLLKAKALDESKSIFKREGPRYKLNRSGNRMTIDLFESVRLLNSDHVQISSVLLANLEALAEIRDNSIHFYNPDIRFAYKVLEVGTASLRSYARLVQEWFEQGLDKYNFFLMPLTFFPQAELSIVNITQTQNQKNLIKFIEDLEASNTRGGEDSISLRLETKFVKTTSPTAVEVRVTNNPDAPEVRITEEQKIQKYRLPYYKLLAEMNRRYSNYLLNDEFHKIRQKIHNDPRYHWERPSNPLKPERGGTQWYAPEVFEVFDRKYRRR